MGIDIRAYSGLKFIADIKDLSENEQNDLYNEDVVSLFVNPYFSERADGLGSGFYYYYNAVDIMSRSYGGYGVWRSNLSKTLFGVPQEDVWADLDKYKFAPFIEIINFSDCEGVIGPKTSAKLLEDFVDHKEIIKKGWEDSLIPAWRGSQGMDHYVDEWIAGLTLAADNGCVVYG